MKKLFITCIALATSVILNAQKIKSADDIKIDALINKMSVEEKIGQMTQVTLGVIAKDGDANGDDVINPIKLKEAIQKYKVGSILNATAHALDINKWHEIIKEIQDEALSTKNKV
ncbi:MAG TPA: hypothetical protein VHP12_08215, partial [Chitinophagaceae bacterium]|nr:hypothetical protein [Chitinophagaceae bacterium]